MKFLGKSLWPFALGAMLLSGCVSADPGNDGQHSSEISDHLMQTAPVSPGAFEVTRSVDGQWHFNAIGAKGEILLISEGYGAKPNALNGILSIEENGVHLDSYKIRDLGDGNWAFELRAGNNQVIADSQVYRSEEEANAGVLEARDLVAGILQYKAAVDDGARFDLWKEPASGKWLFVMRAEDGRVLLESEEYEARTGAVNGLESVRLNGKDLARFQVVQGEQLYFILKAGNGHEIASSAAVFDSMEQAEAAVVETQTLLLSERVANPW